MLIWGLSSRYTYIQPKWNKYGDNYLRNLIHVVYPLFQEEFGRSYLRQKLSAILRNFFLPRLLTVTTICTGLQSEMMVSSIFYDVEIWGLSSKWWLSIWIKMKFILKKCFGVDRSNGTMSKALWEHRRSGGWFRGGCMNVCVCVSLWWRMRIREFFIDEMTFIVSLAKNFRNLLRLVGL